MKKFNIAIIGAGNVGWHVAQALEDAGHTISYVFSKTGNSAIALANALYDTTPVDSLEFRESNVEIIIIAVPDDAIAEVVEQLWIDESTMVFHTSATHPMKALEWVSPIHGVFYPLQTFTKGRVLDFSTIPICIEASNDEVRQVLIDLASSVSNQVYEIGSEQRKALHIAAVLACNFTNYLYSLSSEFLSDNDLSFSLLHALIKETTSKAIDLGPEASQTGPALRNDISTMKAHLNALESHSELAQLYRQLSEGIMNKYSDDKENA